MRASSTVAILRAGLVHHVEWALTRSPDNNAERWLLMVGLAQPTTVAAEYGAKRRPQAALEPVQTFLTQTTTATRSRGDHDVGGKGATPPRQSR